jgi:hypothetical protein
MVADGDRDRQAPAAGGGPFVELPQVLRWHHSDADLSGATEHHPIEGDVAVTRLRIARNHQPGSEVGGGILVGVDDERQPPEVDRVPGVNDLLDRGLAANDGRDSPPAPLEERGHHLLGGDAEGNPQHGPIASHVGHVHNPLPIGELFDLFLRIQPGMKTAGTIYNASESNSQVINRRAKAEAERRGLKWVEVTVAGSADVRTATESLVGKVDGLILGQDNTVASAFEAVVKVAQERQLPVFSMDTQAPARGAIASLAASNYEQGVLWAKELVVPVLLGTDPATMTPVRPRVFDLQVNVQAASAAKLTIPKDIVDRATKVHGR